MKPFRTNGRAIPAPDAHHGRKDADLGRGFYLTPEELAKGGTR